MTTSIGAKETGSFLRCFGPLGFSCGNWLDSEETCQELVDEAWSAILYAANHEIEPVSCRIYSLRVSLYVLSDCFLLYNPKLMKTSEVITPMRAETMHEQKLLREGPPRLKYLVTIRRRKRTYLSRLSQPMRPLLQRCECLRAGLF
jgi:hypothetical protein